ncbi:MAG: sigma-54-dependent Fis family transcriptional regulator, partial [Cytophagales bacterium]|nr:sigma-54-dependent Fis family transcriptional regulator [Cytophagales bacterium]
MLAVKQRFEIIGNSEKLTHALRVALQVGPTEMSVLISGESGVGKESFSKIIHSLSHRKHGQFIAINCGAIPEGTIDSELFGHEKGAFTGALDQRKGYFEVTNGGTIFLDEIGEMPLGTQARLLRVLENGEFIKVGSSKVQKTDVRVIAASNVNVLDAVDKGKFREDLYYRLNTVPIYVPALRERGGDTLLLFRKFASDISETYRNQVLSLTEDARQVLLSYRFPGNIRQLKNLVQQISVLEMDRVITAQRLKHYLPSDRNLPAIINQDNSPDNFSERDILYKVLFDMKKDMSDMKGLVLEILKNDSSGTEILREHSHLFEDEKPLPELPSNITSPIEKAPLYIDTPQEPNGDYEIEVEDISHEDEDESLSLEKKEKEMIIKALKKNKNKRKYAALDLGISERTLYRKIKQYE